ncbi:hypothetical protein CYLTODRAFT_489397 [Cylindrobasidium torrendii FP15055 ss-10]|uniref:F-box domain-containing protein n=1 Tax=Cylindrobasidium torrendii FP15055 ss-10 TaxID=1314674 RepID=A0A0D7BEB8_9AGAR|nr:hypothetical protein CYLTODRAFT_489397 [Cylindrobasidium torrendii FP15055 ss-10]
MLYPGWLDNGAFALSKLLANAVLTTKRARLSPNSKFYLGQLSTDIIVECVFPLLSVEDILCLRMVNKLFYALTFEPIVWKRISQSFSLPIPYSYPSWWHNYNAGINDAERALVRAITLDNNLRCAEPQVLGFRSLEYGCHILDTKLLLGGQYIVMSLARGRGIDRRYSLAISHIDCPPEVSHPIIIEHALPSRAYSIDAKWMPHKNDKGVMISFVQRFYVKKATAPEEDRGPSAESLDHIPYIDLDDTGYDAWAQEEWPMEFELQCIYITLSDLEQGLSDDSDAEYASDEVPEPTTLLLRYRVPTRIWDPVLFEMDGIPHVGFVEQPRYTLTSQPPDRIVSIRMDGHEARPKMSFCLMPNRIPNHQHVGHRIRQIRVLPDQHQILVIRTVYSTVQQVPTGPLLAAQLSYIELFDIPNHQYSGPVDAAQGFFLRESVKARNFHISDAYHPSFWPESRDALEPVSIYMVDVARRPQAFVHWMLWPQNGIDTATKGKSRYCLEPDALVMQTGRDAKLWGKDDNIRVFAGQRRAFVWGNSIHDRSGSAKAVFVHRYTPRQRTPSGEELCDVEETMMRDGRAALETVFANVVNIHPGGPDSAASETGVSSFTWDESLGRVCYVSKESNVLRIWDFAYTSWKDPHCILEESEPSSPY